MKEQGLPFRMFDVSSVILHDNSNLALFLPLELGVQSMEEITAGGGGGTPPVSSRKRGGGGGGSIRRRKESPCIPPGSVQSSSEDGEGGARYLCMHVYTCRG